MCEGGRGGGGCLLLLRARPLSTLRTLPHAARTLQETFSHTILPRTRTHTRSRLLCSVKVWDLAMEREPVAIFPVQENLRAFLPALYDNDSIFDKFQVRWGPCCLLLACVCPPPFSPLSTHY